MNSQVESIFDSNISSSKSYLTASIDGKTIYFAVQKENAKYLIHEVYDAFVVASIPLALQTGRNIVVNGSISESLFYNLKNEVIPILLMTNKDYRNFEISAQELYSESINSENAIGLAFSCGIDSFCSLEINKDSPTNFQITHFLNFYAGATHNKVEHENKLGNVKNLASLLGIDIIEVDSNITDLITMSHSQIHSVRNMAPALAIQKLLGKFYYSSAYHYKDCGVFQGGTSAHLDPIILAKMGTETMKVYSIGSRFSRVEKTEVVSCNKYSYDFLDVCVDTDYQVQRKESDPMNCGVCWKCNRTLLTLEILGKEKLYERVFNLDKYYFQRDNYIKSIINDESSLSQEVLELAKENKFSPIEDLEYDKLTLINWKIKATISKYRKKVFQRLNRNKLIAVASTRRRK
ncbi:hypothetical protein [Calothrix sp. PCC 6303]|uniref:hypothetical protein n=1 Tax=Calothrix sp. PCC 6303 TaxID=1170562 RepID=UPI001181907D|nr:hypothetical protein [Calothrix sp. PCC 6303]